MGNKLESLSSMKDDAKEHIDKSVELSKYSAEQSRSMSEILSALPTDVDDEILQVARSVESGVQFDANEFAENEIKPEFEIGQQMMSEMIFKARDEIAKNDKVIEAFSQMDSISDFGSAARREGTQKAQGLNESLFDLIEEGNSSLIVGGEMISDRLDGDEFGSTTNYDELFLTDNNHNIETVVEGNTYADFASIQENRDDYLQTKYGWSRIQGEHSAAFDCKLTNPNYNSDSIEWSFNCQRCVPTYELRRRGYDVQVQPRPIEVKRFPFLSDRVVPKGNDHLSYSPFDVWIPPESLHCEYGRESIENYMKDWGDGSRAEIMVLWEGAHGQGHVFVAEQINGSTHFIDPQTGEDGVERYFNDCDLKNIYICRTDNKDISDYIKDCCYRRC